MTKAAGATGWADAAGAAGSTGAAGAAASTGAARSTGTVGGAGSTVRDPGLAAAGRVKVEWARRHMPVLAAVAEELRAAGTLAGRRVGLALHVEAKTANLVLALRDAGARVAICGCNPLSTQDDVAAALAAEAGVCVFAWRGATAAEYESFLERVLETEPELLIDDGGDLIALLHTRRRELLGRVRGASEETTTGVRRLRAMEAEGALAFPVVAVNDARSKHLFDNRYGTGQSTWEAIMRATNLLVAGRTVVVLGYGWCGKGVALRARGLGAQVVVCEVDPIAANEALCDGHQVLPSLEAARVGDVFVTVTGCRDVLGARHFEVMKDGALLANAGHFDVEVDVRALAAMARRRAVARPGVEEFELADGRRLYLLGEGRLVNLAVGDGHPVEIMDLSFALQALALAYVATEGPRLGGRVVPLPRELDEKVARLRLKCLGVSLDELSPAQAEYLASWR